MKPMIQKPVISNTNIVEKKPITQISVISNNLAKKAKIKSIELDGILVLSIRVLTIII